MPKPGIEGGLTENTIASRTFCRQPVDLANHGIYAVCLALRSLHGLRTTNIDARLLPAPPPRNDCPDTEITS